jgi:hypothetical protein
MPPYGRLPLGFALWRGLGALGNLVRLAGRVPQSTPPPSVKPAKLADGIDLVAVDSWTGYVAAACAFLAGNSRAVDFKDEGGDDGHEGNGAM